MWRVETRRLAWPIGTVIGKADLEGCNIDALVQGGHLAPVVQRTPEKPESPRNKSKMKPADPVIENDSADEPEEQE